MKKNFCKIVAIILASSMMSMTVFAAEDSTISNVNTSESVETSQPDNAGSGSDNNSESKGSSENTGSDNSGGQTQPAAPAETQPAASGETQPAASSETQQTAAENENPDTSKSDVTPTSTEDNKVGTPTENADGTTPENTEGKGTGSDDAASSNTTQQSTAEADKPTESGSGDSSSEEEGERRSAQIQSDSWSNGKIEDVMGVKAVSDGQTVTISYKTKSTNEWEHTWQNYPLTITYPDGTTQQIIIDYNKGVHGDNWSDIPGFSVSETSDQADTLTLNISIPASYFASQDFTVSSQQYTTSVSGEVIEDVSTTDPNAVYEGIGLDGNFNDWDAVTKYELKEPEGDHNVESVAWVIDSDRGYVYIYIKDDGNNSATWAGPNHNGKFEILTDLGNRMLIQLTEDGAVVAANGYDVVHQGSQWEISIPISELPENTGGLSFGLYMEESSLSGYGDTGEVGSAVGITYDGNTDDWTYYPSTLIQYATPGTQEVVVDGEAKQYSDEGENIYGYCTTQMPAHLDERGGEYTQAVSVIVNDDWSHYLGMRLVSVDSSGNINWNPQRQGLADGSYEYYIFSAEAWGTSTNINELVPADVCYGKATINISDTKQEMEWYVNTVKLAERYGIDATDVKTVSTQYGRIGQQLVTCAGTTTGPWGGAAMCMFFAAAPFVIKKKFIF
ncbi:MAG: hypothetical protein IJ683_09565 [Butyrivibrio sp.]|nr:Firmicu-CTERM sorting domain-containing protein [Butyrivibrio sp.]MBR1642557.1 hypothetical protein [Butyrivibrio sp.]